MRNPCEAKVGFEFAAKVAKATPGSEKEKNRVYWKSVVNCGKPSVATLTFPVGETPLCAGHYDWWASFLPEYLEKVMGTELEEAARVALLSLRRGAQKGSQQVLD